MRITFWQTILGVLVLAILIGVGIFVYRIYKPLDLPPPVSSDRDRAAPDILFYDYERHDVRLSDFKGRPLIVGIWATWCAVCQKELLLLAEERKKHGDALQIVAVNRRETLEQTSAYPRPGIESGLIFVLDQSDAFYRTIGGFVMPETLFIDREGNVRYHHRGSMSREQLKRRIEDSFGLQS